MTARLLSLVLTLAVLVALGCKQHEPLYPTDVDLGSSGEPLLPRGLTLVYSDELTKGKVSGAPDPSQLATQAIRNIPSKALKLAQAGQWNRLPSALLVPEQAEEVDKMLAVLGPLIEKLAALNTLTSERFAEQIKQMAAAAGAPADPTKMMAELTQQLQAAVASAPITMDGEDAAVMDLKLQLNLPGVPQGPGGGGAPQVPIPFVMLEDGSWRIELPYFPPTELLAQTRSNLDAQVPGISQQIDQVMHDIQSGSLTNPQAIQQRLMMSSFGLMGAFTPIIDHVRQAMAGEPAEPHADPGQPPDTEDAEPPAPEDGGQE